MTREPSAEVWTCAGLRIGKHGKRCYLWLDAEGRQQPFIDKGRHFIVGGVYDVNVTRDGDTITRSLPQFTGQRSDDERRLEWTALDRAAGSELARMALERKFKAAPDDLDVALRPLLALASKMRGSQKSAFVAIVTQKIASTW